MIYRLKPENACEVISFREISMLRHAKKQQIKMKKRIITVFCTAMVLLGIIIIVPSVKAKAESTVSYETRIVSVRVTQNDSLWTIAERFYCKEKESIPEFIRSIKEINHLDDDTIYPDTYLVVSYLVKKDM